MFVAHSSRVGFQRQRAGCGAVSLALLIAVLNSLAAGAAFGEPEIDVEGQGMSIADNDLTPNPADDTDFGNAIVGGPSVDHVFTIQNEGTADLNVTAIIATGTHGADFSVSGVTLPLVISAAASAPFTVSFAPSVVGTRSAAIDIANDDADESPYDFSIQGFGLPPEPEIDVEGQGMSIADADLTPDPADDTDFGNADVGGPSVDHVFTIQNEGIADLNVTAIIVSGLHGADFSVSGVTLPLVISPASSAPFTVSFDPSAAGTRSAAIDISNDDANENPYDFAIAGVGEADMPEIDVEGQGISIADNDLTPNPADDTDFGNAIVSEPSVDHVFTIQNEGTADLNVTAIAAVGVHGADFSVSGVTLPLVISPAASAPFTVSFAPSAVGTRSAAIDIANDDADESPYDFSIQGFGLPPEPEIDVKGQGISIADADTTPDLADDTDFGGGVVGGTPVGHVFLITNEGTADLNVTAIVASGSHAADFSVSGVALPLVIAPAGSAPFTVSFAPSALGARSAAIDISNDDADENPYDFAIQGFGISQPVPSYSGPLRVLLIATLVALGAAATRRRSI